MPSTDVVLVSELIRDRRKRKGLTQLDLAERLGVARNTINRWEKGDDRSKPTEENRKRLAKVLGGKPDEYEWTELDHERSARLTRIRLEAEAYVRRLLADEEG